MLGLILTFYAVKALDNTGVGYVSDVIEGLQWSVDNGVDVVNMSFASSVYVQALHDALISLKSQDVVLVAAAGNSGPGDNTVQYPAKYPQVIAVSATNQSDGQPFWSSRGPEVDIAAPGVSAYSTFMVEPTRVYRELQYQPLMLQVLLLWFWQRTRGSHPTKYSNTYNRLQNFYPD